MERQYFGTDGIRGVANKDLTPEFVFRLGQATGTFLKRSKRPHRVVIGRDPRKSGSMLAAAICAGINSVGISVDRIGIVPTPVVTFAARVFDYGIGIVVSASHNPAPDNGIKLIGHDGRKLADDEERQIEAILEKGEFPAPIGADVGEIVEESSSVEAYLGFLEALIPERLDNLKIAVDAANGAAYKLAPEILIRLGATIVVTGAEPDGININANGGATNPAIIQQITVDHGCDLGVAFDGDADRAVFSDSQGRLINGDRTMGIWAAYWRTQGKFDPPVVVGTVMSNRGFERYLNAEGIQLIRAKVGDKYVAKQIEEQGARVGGEQSGHIIFPHNGPTGDGLATMLELLRVLRRTGRCLDDFFTDFEPTPQLLINVGVLDKTGWEENVAVSRAITDAARALEGKGRFSVRASGTQPMIRVMVDADSASLRDEVAGALSSVLISELGGKIYSRVDLTHGLGD